MEEEDEEADREGAEEETFKQRKEQGMKKVTVTEKDRANLVKANDLMDEATGKLQDAYDLIKKFDRPSSFEDGFRGLDQNSKNEELIEFLYVAETVGSCLDHLYGDAQPD
jgi:hypothetical protein